MPVGTGINLVEHAARSLSEVTHISLDQIMKLSPEQILAEEREFSSRLGQVYMDAQDSVASAIRSLEVK